MKQTQLSKKEQITEMFDNIAGTYDFLNHFLSMGIDVLWRKKAIKLLKPLHPKTILDVATGTGDFAIQALSLIPEKIIGVDISEKMLAAGREKLRRKNLDSVISLIHADSELLPFTDNSFDAVIVGFGVRNFENLQKGLVEIRRVLRKDGKVVVLEFSQPERFPVKQLYKLYFTVIVPFAGRLVSQNQRAYTYLPQSVQHFPYGQQFLTEMKTAGFSKLQMLSLTFGIAAIYTGTKVTGEQVTGKR